MGGCPVFTLSTPVVRLHVYIFLLPSIPRVFKLPFCQRTMALLLIAGACRLSFASAVLSWLLGLRAVLG